MSGQLRSSSVASVAGHARQATVGMRVPPLGAGPFVFDTAEVPKIRVTVVARGLSHPWSLVFLPTQHAHHRTTGAHPRCATEHSIHPHPRRSTGED
jgi:glucose/arabinose dehydrogenase